MQDFTMVVERTAAAAARRLLVLSERPVALVMREDGILFLLSMLICFYNVRGFTFRYWSICEDVSEGLASSNAFCGMWVCECVVTLTTGAVSAGTLSWTGVAAMV